MDEALLGYVLGALDEDERRETAEFLEAHPEARERADLFRQALEPLAADRDPIEPPPDLWVRTLARVAEHACRPLPVPPAPSLRWSAPPSPWWRRADVLVAAGILFCVCMLIPPALIRMRFQATITACQENLRGLYAALEGYSDHHGGNFPDLSKIAPARPNTPAVFAAALSQDQLLPERVSLHCPAVHKQAVKQLSVQDLEKMALAEFQRQVREAAGCYAYSLGYADATGIHGLRLVPGQSVNAFLPIMADRPPDDAAISPGNSASHGGIGQNVLYIDGHCRFATRRNVGVNGDDIYVNYDNQVAPGKSPWDAVLASDQP